MQIRTIILSLFLSASVLVAGQSESLIGLHKEDVKEIVKKKYKDFGADNSIVKQQFNYLKYINGSQTITWIIYFSENDICTSTKKVCDYSEYDFVLEELNENFGNTGSMQWEYGTDDLKYEVTLVEEDWYFTVREKLKENKK